MLVRLEEGFQEERTNGVDRPICDEGRRSNPEGRPVHRDEGQTDLSPA